MKTLVNPTNTLIFLALLTITFGISVRAWKYFNLWKIFKYPVYALGMAALGFLWILFGEELIVWIAIAMAFALFLYGRYLYFKERNKLKQRRLSEWNHRRMWDGSYTCN